MANNYIFKHNCLDLGDIIYLEPRDMIISERPGYTDNGSQQTYQCKITSLLDNSFICFGGSTNPYGNGELFSSRIRQYSMRKENDILVGEWIDLPQIQPENDFTMLPYKLLLQNDNGLYYFYGSRVSGRINPGYIQKLNTNTNVWEHIGNTYSYSGSYNTYQYPHTSIVSINNIFYTAFNSKFNDFSTSYLHTFDSSNPPSDKLWQNTGIPLALTIFDYSFNINNEWYILSSQGEIKKFNGSGWEIILTGFPSNIIYATQCYKDNSIYILGTDAKLYNWNLTDNIFKEVKSNLPYVGINSSNSDIYMSIGCSEYGVHIVGGYNNLHYMIPYDKMN